MPNQCVSTHGNIVIDAEVHDAGSIVQRNADICSAALGLHQRCIRFHFIFALNAVIILQHAGNNGGVFHSTAVENIAHPKIVGELVFQSLFRSRCKTSLLSDFPVTVTSSNTKSLVLSVVMVSRNSPLFSGAR